jgi:hypothetical protein
MNDFMTSMKSASKRIVGTVADAGAKTMLKASSYHVIHFYTSWWICLVILVLRFSFPFVRRRFRRMPRPPPPRCFVGRRRRVVAALRRYVLPFSLAGRRGRGGNRPTRRTAPPLPSSFVHRSVLPSPFRGVRGSAGRRTRRAGKEEFWCGRGIGGGERIGEGNGELSDDRIQCEWTRRSSRGWPFVRFACLFRASSSSVDGCEGGSGTSPPYDISHPPLLLPIDSREFTSRARPICFVPHPYSSSASPFFFSPP